MEAIDLALLQYARDELSSDEMKQFMMVMPTRSKSVSTGVLFALLLGGLGVHKFWLGQNGIGVLYLLMGTIGWALVVPPILIAIACIVDACQMRETVSRANVSAGRQLIQEMKMMRPS